MPPRSGPSWSPGGSNPELPNGGDYFPKGCNGNIYKLVEKTIDAYVVKTYMFIAAHAPALDAWLYTDYEQIIGEVHGIQTFNPADPKLRYWESERDFEPDSIYVHTVWILIKCYPQGSSPTSLEPCAIVYVRDTP